MPCTIQDVTVKAKVWLYPETLESVLETAQDRLEAAFNTQKSLGWDVTKSWLNAYLYVEGIQNIELESPLDDLLVADDACTALKSCELTLAGRTW